MRDGEVVIAAVDGERGLLILLMLLMLDCTESRDSVSYCCCFRPDFLLSLMLLIRYTPTKVRLHPIPNFTTRCFVTPSKSRYSTALPMITLRVNNTNWVGMTWVLSNLCNARLRYFTCRMAVTARIKVKR